MFGLAFVTLIGLIYAIEPDKILDAMSEIEFSFCQAPKRLHRLKVFKFCRKPLICAFMKEGTWNLRNIYLF